MWLFKSTFGKVLMTFFISMVPVIELRGAVPYGYGQLHLPLWSAILISIIGNLVPVPIIIIYVRKVFNWLRTKSGWLDRIVIKLENRAMKKADTVRKFEFWGLFILVAIPLPGTGAWTGALVAAMLDMRLKRAFPAIALGVITAGVIVSFITYGAKIFIF